MKRMSMVVLLLAVGALGVVALSSSTPAVAAPKNCSTVRCAGCPDGQHLLLNWPNCCACVPN